MKELKKILSLPAVVLAVGVAMTSCSMESPFDDTNSGDGNLRISTVIHNKITTRGDIDAETMNNLRKEAIIYVERKNTTAERHDVVRKYFGLQNVPGSITLPKGNTYLVEGWTGDSVSASFDKKFYRGKTEEFQLEDQSTVTMKMNIANVLVAFAPETFDLDLTDLEMTVGHSRGELTFSEKAEEGSTIHNVGYFMMPSTDTSLQYTISAKTAGGEYISRSGVIENVERAHQYQVRLRANASPDMGGGLIKIEIEDIPIIEENNVIYGKPLIEGVEFELSEQVVGTPGNFNEKIVYVCGYNALSSLVVGGDNAPEVIKNLTNNDLTNNTQAEAAEFENIGIHIEHEYKTDAADGTPYDTYNLFFKKEFFDALPPSETEYVIEIYAVDRNSKYSYATLRVANTEGAIEVQAPIETVKAPDPNRDPMAIKATSATLNGYLYDFEAQDYGIEYRAQGSTEWTRVAATAPQSSRRKGAQTRADKQTFSVTLTNLTPGTTYEFRSYCGEYNKSAVMTFQTEGVFTIPNASFENWSTYTASTMLGTRTVIFPGSGGRNENPFWESGNEGAATASMTLTDKSTDMIHSGTYSARLESKSAMGVIAAGNVFTGTYVKTDGTNGVLSLGRPYNSSHPSKLKVWTNYRPASGVSVKSGNEDKVPSGFAGGTDHGQIYVALSTEPVEIRTNPKNLKVFNPDDNCVVAYGEKTWTGDFGPEGGLEAVEITINYNERANTQRPQYLIIVVSASKYGDYFSGAPGSVFYLDDFELIYE